MEFLAILLIVYAVKKATEDSGAAWRKSKAAYMRSANERFPNAPKSRRAAQALRHDLGYWSAETFRGFPAARHGFAAGWHSAKGEQAQRKAARELAKAEHLEARADAAPQVAAFRRRQSAARERLRDAARPATVPGTAEGAAGEGSAGSPAGGTAPEQASPPRPEPAGAEPDSARTYSYGPAGVPYQWPTGADGEQAHRWAQLMSADGRPYQVTVYPPGGGQGTTDATYLAGQEVRPSAGQQAEWDARARARMEDDLRQGRVTREAEVPGDCHLCGQPLAEGDEYSHGRCEAAYREDCAVHEIAGNRDLDEVEPGLREQGRCPWQVRPAGWDGGAVYCGQPLTDTGGDEPDLFCLRHQAEAYGDHDGAARELTAHVQSLLRRQEQQETGPAVPQQSPQPEGEAMAAEVTYGSVFAGMSSAALVAFDRAGEQDRMKQQASSLAEQMQALSLDPATLGAMADYIDANDKAARALQAAHEAAETVAAALQRGHAGLNEAHQNAPVDAADKTFYAG